MSIDIVNLLVTVFVIVVVCVGAKYLVDYMEFPPPLRLIVLAFVGLVCLLALLYALGLIGSGGTVLHWKR
jgi:hypothetical protein